MITDALHRETAVLQSGKSTAVLQPLPRPPQRHSQRLAIPATAQPPVLLVANVACASGLAAVLGDAAGRGVSKPDLYLNLTLQSGVEAGSVTSTADSWGVSSFSSDCKCQYKIGATTFELCLGLDHLLTLLICTGKDTGCLGQHPWQGKGSYRNPYCAAW
jgi:hypothetical protein